MPSNTTTARPALHLQAGFVAQPENFLGRFAHDAHDIPSGPRALSPDINPMQTRSRLARLLAYTVLTFCLVFSPTANSDTLLGEYIELQGVNTAAWDPAMLQQRMASGTFEELKGDRVFAYSLLDTDGKILPVIHIDRYNPMTRQVRTCVVDCEGLEAQGINLGSIWGFLETAHGYIVTTHNTPSRNTAIAVTEDGTVEQIIPGTPKALLENGAVVYGKGQPHFMSFHYSELMVLNLDTGEEYLIYPAAPPSKVRRAHIEAVREVFAKRGEDWFRINNHHGDPEKFTDYMGGEVAVNLDLDAIAFTMVYDHRDLQIEPKHVNETTRVMCVYRNVGDPDRMEWRELLLADFERQFGTAEPAECVKPEVLDKVFSTPLSES